MRWRPVPALILAAMTFAGTGMAFAQYPGVFPGETTYNADPRRARRPPPPGYYRPAPPPGYGQPPRQAYRGGPYYPGMLINPQAGQALAPPPPQPGFSLRRLFGIEDEPPRQVVVPKPPRVKPDRPRPAVAVARPEKPKVNPSAHVVVFGDQLADLTGQGLEDAFEETPDVAVARKTRSEGGLARSEVGEWPKFISEVLDGGQKATVAVVMLGSNDRQPIKEGETTHEPLSDRWKELYRERVDALVKNLAQRGLPVVWIGVPPIRNDKLSADYIAINEISRESVERIGGTYVDIWPGFVNDENRYTATGPDVDGQASRLRTQDGVLFTRAGARKAAHFADAEIKRLIDASKAGTALAALPSPAAATTPAAANADPLLSLPPPPEVPGLPALPSKPLVGPVMPLTRPDLSPGGALVSARPKLEGDAAYTVQKALREGVAPSPRPGRADDYRWPKL
jgi:uncharacterized protein